MKHIHIRKLWHPAIVISVVIVVLLAGSQAKPTVDSSYSLAAPSFISVVHAASENQATVLIEDEAGISAYFESTTPITINSVRDIYQTIELETSDYILGTVALADIPEEHAPHVYVHVDGWFLAYYLDNDPVAKIIDFEAYSASGDTIISTKLEGALAIVAGAAGVGIPGITHYDFRHPNATTMMLIVERDQGGGNDYFTVNIPSNFGVSERSWAERCYGGCNYFLNGTNLEASSAGAFPHLYGSLSASQLPPDTTHNITIDGNNVVGGLALVYTE